jgi:hypothetical protein
VIAAVIATSTSHQSMRRVVIRRDPKIPRQRHEQCLRQGESSSPEI